MHNDNTAFAVDHPHPAVVAQLVEHQLPKLRVTSSSLAYRSNNERNRLLLNKGIILGFFFILLKKLFKFIPKNLL